MDSLIGHDRTGREFIDGLLTHNRADCEFMNGLLGRDRIGREFMWMASLAVTGQTVSSEVGATTVRRAEVDATASEGSVAKLPPREVLQ